MTIGADPAPCASDLAGPRLASLLMGRPVMHLDSEAPPPADVVALCINGTEVGTAPRAEMARFDAILRGIARSDSPILIRADRDEDRRAIVDRLHALGRRGHLAIHHCSSREKAQRLLALSREPALDASGTWALSGVASWPRSAQRALGLLLGVLDESRLEQRVPHERLPRVIVLERESDAKSIDAELAQRLSFFEIRAGAPAAPKKHGRSRRA